MSNDCQVFISHAGVDKFTVAIPLFENLVRRSISAFVDKKGLLCGDEAPVQMEYFMETAPIGVFILSPEFLAKKWPMKELLCFQRRVDEAKRKKLTPPALIPVFYRLTVAQCGSKEIFKAKNAEGENVFVESDFYERMEKGETSRTKLLHATSRLVKHTGIENEEEATNTNTPGMIKKRSHLVERIASEVQQAVTRRSPQQRGSSSQANAEVTAVTPGDMFSPHYLVPLLSSNVRLDFTTRDERGDCVTAEGKFKDKLMSTLLRKDNSSAAAVGRVTSSAPGALGMGGVGKSTAMIGVAWEDDVRDEFHDGIYLLSGGENADAARILSELARLVDGCGGKRTAAQIRTATSLKHGVDMASGWFHQKRILLLLDDIWETETSSVGFFEQLRRVVSSAGRVAVTTRNKGIAQAAGCPVYFDAFAPRAEESRRMLSQYAGIEMNSADIYDDNSDSDLDYILDRCAGLPLALGIAGRAIRNWLVDGDMARKTAIRRYARSLSEGEDVEMLGPLGEYQGLRRMVKVSLETVDQWVRSQGLLSFTSTVQLPSELFERLCVLRKQARVPIGVLAKLWGMKSSMQARGIANKLSNLSLLLKEGDHYGVHDLLMDVCIFKASTNDRLRSYHEGFLRAFSDPVAEGNTRAWWTDGMDSDGYMQENIARHLVCSGHVDELHALLIDARWTLFRIKGGNHLSWENDFTELLSEMDHAAQDHPDALGRERQGQRRAFKLIRDAVGQGWHELLVNPLELAFQMIGRLQGYCGEFGDIDAYLASVKKFAGRPWLKPKQQCLSSPEDALQFTLRLDGSVYALAVDRSTTRAFVGVGKNILVIELRHRVVVGKMKGHVGDVTSLAISIDGQHIVSGSWDKNVCIWDAKRMRQMGEPLQGHTGVVRCVAISQDGKWVVSGSEDKTLRVWDTERMRQLGEPLEGHTGSVECVVISQNGKQMVSGSADWTLRLWDAELLLQVGEPLEGHSDVVECVAISPDGKRIVSGSWDETLRVWEIEHMRQVGEPLKGHTVQCVAISQDGKLIVSGSRYGTLRVWDAELMRQVGEPLEGHTGSVEGLAISQDGKMILSGSEDTTFRVWDMESMRQVGEPPKGHTGRVWCVAISEDGKMIMSGSEDKTLRAWDVESMQQVGEPLKGHAGSVRCVAISRDGKMIVSGSEDGTLRVWDAERMRQIGEPLEGHTDLVECVAISQDGKRIVSGSRDEKLILWDAENMRQEGEPLEGHTDSVVCVVISQDGKWIVSGSWDESLLLWHVDHMRQVGDAVQVEGFVRQVQFLGMNVVSCTTDEESQQFRVDKAMGLVPMDSLRLAHREVALRKTMLRCVGTEVWMDSPWKILLGTLEKSIWTWSYDEISNVLVTGLWSGSVLGFELIRSGRDCADERHELT